MLKRALKRTSTFAAANVLAIALEAANAQTGIETPTWAAPQEAAEALEAANAQTGIETGNPVLLGDKQDWEVRSSECSNGH